MPADDNPSASLCVIASTREFRLTLSDIRSAASFALARNCSTAVESIYSTDAANGLYFQSASRTPRPL